MRGSGKGLLVRVSGVSRGGKTSDQLRDSIVGVCDDMVAQSTGRDEMGSDGPDIRQQVI